MSKKLIGVYFFFIVSVLFLLVPSTFATKFDLIPPSGTQSRGQDITFTINIDTEGASVTSIQAGLTYDSTLLKYVSVTAGAAMNTVVADSTTYGAGKVLFTGTSNAGYNGTGVFATVVFNIIAQSSGQTDVCTLWLPEPTPTPPPEIPTSTPGPACGSVCTTNSQCPSDMPCYILAGQTSGFCRRPACPEINNCVCPAPTALPTSGGEDSKNIAVGASVVFFAAAVGIFYVSQKSKYSQHHEIKHKRTKKHK